MTFPLKPLSIDGYSPKARSRGCGLNIKEILGNRFSSLIKEINVSLVPASCPANKTTLSVSPACQLDLNLRLIFSLSTAKGNNLSKAGWPVTKM